MMTAAMKLKEYYQNNREKILVKRKKHYQDNREYTISRQKEYYQNNIEKIRKRSKIYAIKYRENNREILLYLCLPSFPNLNGPWCVSRAQSFLTLIPISFTKIT